MTSTPKCAQCNGQLGHFYVQGHTGKPKWPTIEAPVSPEEIRFCDWACALDYAEQARSEK